MVFKVGPKALFWNPTGADLELRSTGLKPKSVVLEPKAAAIEQALPRSGASRVSKTKPVQFRNLNRLWF